MDCSVISTKVQLQGFPIEGMKEGEKEQRVK